jgi:hypothetical protein
MKRKILIIIGITCMAIISGCAPQRALLSAKTELKTERIFHKNYEIGKPLSVFVGQPIIKVKDYTANRLHAKHMRASGDFEISGGIVKIHGQKNVDYVVAGDATVNGTRYTHVLLPDSNLGPGFRAGALIMPDGRIHSQVLNYDSVMVYDFTAIPESLTFSPSTKEEIQIDINAGFVNYELIYGGTDGRTITITYREYTSNDLARPAFFQNLVYEAGAKQIRFRNTTIQVHDVTNEKIVLTILADDL